MTHDNAEPTVHVFPAAEVARGLHYYFSGKFPQSSSFHLSLDFKPQGQTKQAVKTVGEYIDEKRFREAYGSLGLVPVLR